MLFKFHHCLHRKDFDMGGKDRPSVRRRQIGLSFYNNPCRDSIVSFQEAGLTTYAGSQGCIHISGTAGIRVKIGHRGLAKNSGFRPGRFCV
jgi:hypothetical protein